MTAELHEWAVVTSDPYAAPEVAGIKLEGTVYGHPSKADGKPIRTSRVVSVDGRTVTTLSGTVYELHEPCEGYRQWLAEHRPNWDPEHPVTLIANPRSDERIGRGRNGARAKRSRSPRRV